MRSILRTIALVACILLVAGGTAQAQNLSQQLGTLGPYAKSYVSPLFQAWAADLNTGFYHSADLHDVLGIDVGVKFVFAKFTDEDRTYQFVLPPSISYGGLTLTGGANGTGNYDLVTTVPTAVGSTDPVPIRIRNTGTSLDGKALLTHPKGYAPAAIGVPLIVPQAAIGLPLGFEVIARFIPTVKLNDYGKASYYGFGLRHDIDQYIPGMPLDIAAHFMMQKFNLKDSLDNNFLTGTGTAFGIEASAKLLFLTVYGGFQVESGKFTMNDYTATFVDQNTGQILTAKIPGFTIDSKNSSRFTVGARVLLGFLNVHAEYSSAKQPVLAAGVGITFR